MSDAELAAVAALIGVGLSGGVQVGLKAWEDQKTRRAAIRPVTSELGSRLAWLQQDLRIILLSGSLPACPAWETYRDVLARELPDRKWQKVSSAFSAYELVRGEVAAYKEAGVSTGAKLRMLKAALDYARANVRSGCAALMGAAAAEAVIRAAPQGKVEVTVKTTSTQETTLINFDRNAEGERPSTS